MDGELQQAAKMTTEAIRHDPPRNPHSPMSPNKDYQDVEETRDSKLKAVWDKEMSKMKSEFNTHETVSVLLLSWHPEFDDLNTQEEVTNLEAVFKDKFQYTTRRATLKDGTYKSAQVQLNKHLSDFVFDHDAANALLIVYYAGHGRPGQKPGGLHLTGSTSLPSSDSEIHEVVWNSAETLIKDTKGDVLVIFDCCHAGELERSVRAPLSHRAFEFLAATSAKSTTPKPGPKSFTSALIHSLSELVKEGSFSTQELAHNIQFAPNFSEDQCPRLHERHPSSRKIVMSALTQESIKEAMEANQSNDNKNDDNEDDVEDVDGLVMPRHHLLIRYVFDQPIDEDMVRHLAKNSQQLLNHSKIKAKAASWEQLIGPQLSFQEAKLVQPVVNALKSLRKRNIITNSTPKILVSDAVQVPSPVPSSNHGSRVATPDRRLPAESEICEEGLRVSAQASSPTISRHNEEGTKTPVISEPKLRNKRRRDDDDNGCDPDIQGKRVKLPEEAKS